MRRFAALVFCAWTSCAPQGGSIALGPEWRPLERVLPDPRSPEGRLSTRAPYVWTKDPAFICNGSVENDAALSHERVHAQRQLDYGIAAWTSAYADPHDSTFRTNEELLGWTEQIRYSKAHGVLMDPYWVGLMLTTIYEPKLGLTYEQAVVWAGQEVSK